MLLQTYDDPLLYQVNLLNAQNEAKNRNHKLLQKFKLTNKWSLLKINFLFLANRKIYTDQNPNSGFYQNIYLDSTSNIRFYFLHITFDIIALELLIKISILNQLIHYRLC